MAFSKTSVGLTPASQVASPIPRRGEEKDGQIWDGTKWISVAQWESQNASASELPGVVPEATALKDA